MKTILAGLFLAFASSLRAEPIDLDRMIDAIAQIEGHAVNDLGGPGRMLRGTWYDRTKLAYVHSRSPEYCRPVYKAHLIWITEQYRNRHIKVTPETLYLAWRRGVEGAVVRLRGPMSDIAVRCGRIYRGY